MFTGIIEGLGTISGARPAGSGRRVEIRADYALSGTKIGDSIAVNGACLTAVEVSGAHFAADVSPESLRQTTIGDLAPGHRVNLERALRPADRLDGHIVSGHIDGTARITSIKNIGEVLVIGFSAKKALTRYMIHKGSVAVDGISLTINSCGDSDFEVSIIPHTAEITTLGLKSSGDSVNIETDLIGKYVEKFLFRPGNAGSDPPASDIDMDLLAKTGFL
ncbi:MAG: riboflavin synthase [Thermodesulfobacteriota bacterium]